MAEKKDTKAAAEEPAVEDKAAADESAAPEPTEEEAHAAEAFVEAAQEADEPIETVVPEPAGDEPAADADQTAPAAEEAAEETVDGPAGADAEPAEGGQTAAAQPAGPKPKKKRLPRSLRRERTKPKREKPKERRPITRLPKPERERGRRQERQGTVVSDAMDKTIVVEVDVIKAHPKYKKVVRGSTKFHAHDERNEAKNGDVVRIVETRPISRQKHWRLAEIVEAAK